MRQGKEAPGHETKPGTREAVAAAHLEGSQSEGEVALIRLGHHLDAAQSVAEQRVVEQRVDLEEPCRRGIPVASDGKLDDGRHLRGDAG